MFKNKFENLLGLIFYLISSLISFLLFIWQLLIDNQIINFSLKLNEYYQGFFKTNFENFLWGAFSLLLIAILTWFFWIIQILIFQFLTKYPKPNELKSTIKRNPFFILGFLQIYFVLLIFVINNNF